MTTLTEAYYRRLYAFEEPSPVIPIEEFYSPAEPRDKNGKWTRSGGGSKVWSGMSAHPDHRTRPKSSVSFPIEPEGYESPAEARAIFGSRVYDADLGKGYQARVVQVTNIPNGVSVLIKIRKGHEEAATSTRELALDGAGRLVAHHETLYVNPKHQNQGIADKFNAHAVAEYQRLGVDRIDLHAGDTVGGYAWARQGFRIFEGDRKKFLTDQLDRLPVILKKPVLRPHAKKIMKDAAALRKAIEAGEDVQPIHLAALGEKYARHKAQDDHGNTYTTWPGKSLLIGTNWLGQYYFDGNKAVTAAATDLAHAALRSEQLNYREHKHTLLVEALACHDAACAPPPAGTGGSVPSGALQARRGVVAGYTQQSRRDIHLAGVRVTYKPDYPDDHPDPGEVVWAKVRYQEDVNQSKDRPVLIIGRINGSNKLAAVQLTSQITGRKDQHVVGPGSWDRLGRNSAVKLDQIIVIDPQDYRREGSKFERTRFDDVIGRLAAYHRTPVQIAAGGTWIELYNHEHDPHSGKFTGHGGARVITKEQARGDSRPVSHEEFQRLAAIGRGQLEGFAQHAKKINLSDEHWAEIKHRAYYEVQELWGGSTIDLHTGKPLSVGDSAFAITVKGTKGKQTQNSISVHETATEEDFNAAMDNARQRFGYTLARESHYLGVFHDASNHRIDIDPVLVVHRHADVETIGAATHAIGGAYNFKDGNGYWPPHVDTSPTATNKRDDIQRTLYD